MTHTLDELARLVDGQLSGAGSTRISGADTIREARAGDITLADSPVLAQQLADSKASAVVVSASFQHGGIPSISVEDVHAAFAKIVSQFRPQPQRQACGVSPQAWVAASVKIGAGVDIHPGASVGESVEIGAGTIIHGGVRILAGCKIGENSIIFPNAVLYENTIIGQRVIIHANAVIGAYGFGYRTVAGRHQLSAQLGCVEIADDVEVGACTTIDRGTYGPTTIGEGTKIDNQVMIAHNCRIGRHNLLCSHVGIAGSCSTGDYVVMAGQVGVGDHIHIGDRTTLGAKSGIMSDIPGDSTFVGIPATPAREQMVKQAALAKLPEMRKQLKSLEKTIARLTDESATGVRGAA